MSGDEFMEADLIIFVIGERIEIQNWANCLITPAVYLDPDHRISFYDPSILPDDLGIGGKQVLFRLCAHPTGARPHSD